MWTHPPAPRPSGRGKNARNKGLDTYPRLLLGYRMARAPPQSRVVYNLLVNCARRGTPTP